MTKGVDEFFAPAYHSPNPKRKQVNNSFWPVLTNTKTREAFNLIFLCCKDCSSRSGGRYSVIGENINSSFPCFKTMFLFLIFPHRIVSCIAQGETAKQATAPGLDSWGFLDASQLVICLGNWLWDFWGILGYLEAGFLAAIVARNNLL